MGLFQQGCRSLSLFGTSFCSSDKLNGCRHRPHNICSSNVVLASMRLLVSPQGICVRHGLTARLSESSLKTMAAELFALVRVRSQRFFSSFVLLRLDGCNGSSDQAPALMELSVHSKRIT
jgi:hypothetical protein